MRNLSREISCACPQVDTLRESSPAFTERNFQGWPKEAATMPKKSGISKGFAVAFVVLTVCAIAGMISMMVVYEIQTNGLNMTAPPIITTSTPPPPPVMRLPRSLIPESYDIILQPHLYTSIKEEVNVTTPNQTLTFTGNSTVHFQCHQDTTYIFLHSLGLNVFAPRVIDKDTGNPIKVRSVKHHEDVSHFLEINVDGRFKAGGNYSLFLAFEGEISEYLQALYVSKYTETNKEAVNETIEER
ncbi:hypothetical protein GOODEAATRI_006187 [Goodea atripinnis]|uniref:Aminopeptidase N-like N-terminal domain-containing protein n=1 Tax=Goodea atripinnis TaxID=208336 RepID=A0ABV0PBR5_9TELE